MTRSQDHLRLSGRSNERPPRLLYLGGAFPPGVSALFPHLQPPGQLIETSLVESISKDWDIRSVGTSDIDIGRLPRPLPESRGLNNALNLLDRFPEVWHRPVSLWRLRDANRRWVEQGWRPDVVMVCNLTPIYSGFVRWLRRRPSAPCLVLYLADSTSLGLPMPALKRFRYRFKPLVWPQDETARCFDACVAVSCSNEQIFRAWGMPWLWLPNGCDPSRAPQGEGSRADVSPILGYFGALTEYAGLPQLLRCYAARERPGRLRVYGFGKALPHFSRLYAGHPTISIGGPVSPDECLRLARDCDVLVNPRPDYPGNSNNFPSKVFEYALAGRAILSSRISGADVVLGEDAFYFDAADFDQSLEAALTALHDVPRSELDRRGLATRARVLSGFTWARQGQRLSGFLLSLLDAASQEKRPRKTGLISQPTSA